MLENSNKDSRFGVIRRTCIPICPNEPFPDEDVIASLSDGEFCALRLWASNLYEKYCQ